MPANGDPARRVTIVDVARHAGVSTAAVSKVLRNASGVSSQMREKVEQTMRELDYRPLASARGMRGRTYTIGILVSDILNPFFGLLVEGISHGSGQTGYEPLIGTGGASAASQQRTIDAMVDRQMDGLILIAPLIGEAALNRVARQTPTIIVGRHGPSDVYDTVAGDDVAGSRLIVDYLVSLGHRRISHLTHAAGGHRDERRPEVLRERGYVAAMESHGLADQIDVIETAWTREGGERAAAAIVARQNRPTAVHAGADVAAYGLLDGLWRAGVRIPEDVSVIGYDNTPTAAMNPISLTSVDQGGLEMGRLAAELLVQRIEGRSTPLHTLTQPHLVLRSTAGPTDARPQRRPD